MRLRLARRALKANTARAKRIPKYSAVQAPTVLQVLRGQSFVRQGRTAGALCKPASPLVRSAREVTIVGVARALKPRARKTTIVQSQQETTTISRVHQVLTVAAQAFIAPRSVAIVHRVITVLVGQILCRVQLALIMPTWLALPSFLVQLALQASLAPTRACTRFPTAPIAALKGITAPQALNLSRSFPAPLDLIQTSFSSQAKAAAPLAQQATPAPRLLRLPRG